jgi:hypothetical protein
MTDIETSDHQMPVTPAAPKKEKSDFAKKMEEAKKKKALEAQNNLRAATNQTPSAFVNQPPPQPIITKQPPKRPPRKQPDKVIFRLIGKLHPVLQNDNIKHGRRPHAFASMTGSVLWPYKNNKPLPLDKDVSELTVTDEYGRTFDNPELQWLPRDVRFVHNLNSPFADEQDAQQGDTLRRVDGRNQILDNAQNRDALVFYNRELQAPAINTVLVNFLWINPQCENMHPKARRFNGRPIYKLLDFGHIDQEKVELGKLREKCYELAKNARLEEMIPHANI